ncbi:M14 family zinc carboxypeptidase [Aeoliella sp. SH292]|uniref:M14 family zinc carboxypeptidase n=1 Tax=Aeoliella sp. SH292 TaxID=3454464 RepID=UPI003F9C970D
MMQSDSTCEPTTRAREFPFAELSARDGRFRKLYSRYQLGPLPSSDIRSEDVQQVLEQLVEVSRNSGSKWPLSVREVGRSFEGRTIQLASIGRGDCHVLLWTQMHGDESTHTSVAFALLNTLVRAPESLDGDGQLLDRCTLHVLPMLNPDGAQRQTRENAQDLDINRDAVALDTPEGNVLRNVVRELRPAFGFNLHNQRADKKVEGSDRVAILSVLAPPLDEADRETPSILRARQLALEMFACGERFLPGHSTRYEAGYMPTAFGEWVQAQGTSTVLLEAGGWVDDAPGTREELHYVTLLTALAAICEGELAGVDAGAYLSLPLNQ